MKTCWLCREDVTQLLANLSPSFVGTRCPSCLVSINREGGQYYEEIPSTANVNIALARAVDRLTKQLELDAKKQGQRELAEKLGIK
jgi:hypothetical protein